MMKNIFFPLALLLTTLSFCQNIVRPKDLNVDEVAKSQWPSLDRLFNLKDYRESPLVGDAITGSMIASFKQGDSSEITSLINHYPIARGVYRLTLIKHNAAGELLKIFALHSRNEQGQVIFSIPLKHLTKGWKRAEVGKVTYFFQDNINIETASKFDSKNSLIATKIGTNPDSLTFFLCANYQEALQLMGFEYHRESNGNTRDGWGVQDGYIFSVMNNEDFSHDILHYYSKKVNALENRNWIAEEGLAYSWGNAYYTHVGTNRAVYQNELVEALRAYLSKKPGASLFDLFSNNTKIFNHIAPEVSAKYLLSSLICDEVERKKGLVGISELINSKWGEEGQKNFLNASDKLIGINAKNFDREVMKLVSQYGR